MAELFGQGLAFPLRVDTDGRLARSSGETNVRESIRLLLLTEPDERLMREEFGGGLRAFLFEPNTATTRELIRQRIAQSIGLWEPRAAVQDVTVEPNSETPSLVAITITYRLVATQTVERLGMALQLEG